MFLLGFFQTFLGRDNRGKRSFVGECVGRGDYKTNSQHRFEAKHLYCKNYAYWSVNYCFIGCSGTNHSACYLYRANSVGHLLSCACMTAKGMWLVYGNVRTLQYDSIMSGWKIILLLRQLVLQHMHFQKKYWNYTTLKKLIEGCYMTVFHWFQVIILVTLLKIHNSLSFLK